MIPAVVHVGPFAWEVVLEDLPSCYGETRLESLTIALRPGMPPQLARETFAHELLHACHLTAGIDDGRFTAERIVAAISPFFVDMLDRNPAVVAFLLAPDAIQSGEAERGGRHG